MMMVFKLYVSKVISFIPSLFHHDQCGNGTV